MAFWRMRVFSIVVAGVCAVGCTLEEDEHIIDQCSDEPKSCLEGSPLVGDWDCGGQVPWFIEPTGRLGHEAVMTSPPAQDAYSMGGCTTCDGFFEAVGKPVYPQPGAYPPMLMVHGRLTISAEDSNSLTMSYQYCGHKSLDACRNHSTLPTTDQCTRAPE